MISVNKVFEAISSERGWIQKIILGSLLMFIPILNIFAMGYLWEYTGKIIRGKSLKLPEWENWGSLFFGGLLFLAIFLAYGVSLVLIGWLIALLLGLLSFGMLGWFAFLPVTIAGLIAPSLTVMGLISLKQHNHLKSLISEIPQHFKHLLSAWFPLLIANLAFSGTLLLGSPIYGAALFIGFIFLIPYTALILVESNSQYNS